MTAVPRWLWVGSDGYAHSSMLDASQARVRELERSVRVLREDRDHLKAILDAIRADDLGEAGE
jgi:hypothetical protein